MTQNEKLITLIKEVVRAEVKKQVNEQLTTLVLRLKQQLDSTSVKTQPIKSKPKMDLMKEDFMDEDYAPVTPRRSAPREFTKNPVLNEILSQTQPFTAAERATGGTNPMASMMGGSVLDSIQRDSEEDWGTVELNTDSMSGMMQQKSAPVDTSANPEGVEAVAKALTRNYSELVKRFK